MWWLDEGVMKRWKRYAPEGSPDECWIWRGGTRGKGYGVFFVGRERGYQGAHRLALERKLGRHLGGDHALHSCDNPPCVNPAHLRPGNGFDNMRDKVTKGRAYNGDQRAEKNGAAKLTNEQVKKIRSMIGTGPTQREIAKLFGVSAATVSEIKNCRHWRDLGG